MVRFRTVSTMMVASALAMSIGAAEAQVYFDTPAYGIPVPGGVLQPDETAGTNPSFQFFPDAYGARPSVRVVQRCQYPDGWNVTDFNRDVNGTPNGADHTCPVYRHRRAR